MSGRIAVIGVVFGALALMLPAVAAANTARPTNLVKLVFVHHSTGENWLSDINGGLGETLYRTRYGDLLYRVDDAGSFGAVVTIRIKKPRSDGSATGGSTYDSSRPGAPLRSVETEFVSTRERGVSVCETATSWRTSGVRTWIIQPYHPANVTLRLNVALRRRVFMLPLTVTSLARLVADLGHTPRVIDENVEPIPLNGQLPDIALITAMTPTAPRAYRIADELRARGVPVVLGGIHPTVAPAEACAHADAVVIGEAEPVIGRIFEDRAIGELAPVYEAVGAADLSQLAPPRWDLLRRPAYQWIKSVEEIRGCPHDCSFCSANKIFGSRVRCRPVERVVEELASMKERFAFFTANDISANRAYARRLFEALIPLGKKWFSQASVEMAEDEELVELASRSGCVGLLVGFESLAGEYLAKARHAVGADRRPYYQRVVETFHRHRIALIGCFVFGLDEQREDIFPLTKEFIEETNIDVPQMTVATPYPGTKMRERLISEGRILPVGWEHYDAVRATIVPLEMSLARLREGYDWICDGLFSCRAIWHRVRRSHEYLGDIYRSYGVVLPVNLVYRKLYALSLQPPEIDPG